MSREEKIATAVSTIKEAIDIRSQITELYRQYGALCNAVTVATPVIRADLKRAVDALYYFGGGWPKETTKGRMEALLDNFVGMYRILDFIGEGKKVSEHLARYGISISLANDFKIENYEFSPNDIKALNDEYNIAALGVSTPKDLQELMTNVVLACMTLQGEICGLADKIKDDLRPAAIEALQIEDAEYDRLHLQVKLGVAGTPKAEDKARSKRGVINTSLQNFNSALKYVRPASK